MLRECKIEELVEQLQLNKSAGRKSALIIGAGVSHSAGIPLASEIVYEIQKRYKNKCASIRPNGYAEHMKMITPIQRKELVNDFIANSKINMAHLYMAKLISEMYFDRILTTNFDTLVSQSLAIENVFPGIYDFASVQDFRAADTAEISIFHLHGQKDGYKLLNTKEEVNKIFESSKKLFEETFQNRTIVVVGYSGENDPVFRHLEQMECFNHSLYWIGFMNNTPDKRILEAILDKENYSYYLKGYTADTFFIDLLNKLEVSPPRIIDKPFSLLLETINNLSELQKDNESIDMTHEIRVWINESINKYESNSDISVILGENDEVDSFEKISGQKLSKLVRDSWINDLWDNYPLLKKSISEKTSINIKNNYAKYLSEYGLYLGNLELDKSGDITFDSLDYVFQIFTEAVSINPNSFEAYNNWGYLLWKLSEMVNENDKTALLEEAYKKTEIASKFKPSDLDILYNMGYYLASLAEYKSSEEAIVLYNKAIGHYNKILEFDTNNLDALFSMAVDLESLAKLTDKEQSQKLLEEAMLKYEDIVEINPNHEDAYTNITELLIKLSYLYENEEAHNILQKAKKIFTIAESNGINLSIYNKICVEALLGNKDEAVKELIKYLETESDISLEYVKNDKDLSSIIDDIRITRILKKMEGEIE